MKTDNNSINRGFFPRQIAYLYENTRVALISNVLLATVTAWFLWTLDVHTSQYLPAWLASIYFVVLIRMLTTYFYRKSSKDPNALLFYYIVFIISVVITGLLWGMTPWVFASAEQPEIALILVFIIGGLTSGATATMSVLSKVYFSYMLSIVIPSTIWFYLQEGDLYFVIALMLSFSIAGFITASLTYKKTLLHSFELTERVLKQKLQVEKASKAKSIFLSNMSHELRTPLNAILGFSQIMRMDKDNLSSEHRKNVTEISNAGDYLLCLIDDLLEISEIDTKNIKLNIEDFDVSVIINECLKLIKATSALKLNIIFKYNENDCAGINVLIDQRRVKQVLLNLLSNACKYNKQNGTVTINCAVVGDYGRISITDTGIGIPLDKQAQLFTSYDRLGMEQTTIQGTGLGLVISQQLLSLMNAKIDFESEEDKGSRFWIDLPLSKNNTD